MIARTVCLFVAFSALGLLEKAFFAPLVGGRWSIDLVLTVALLLTTAVGGARLPALLVATAFGRELFSPDPFGVALVGGVVALASTRMLLFSLFTHRSLLARLLAVSGGLVLASGTILLYRFALLLIEGTGGMELLGDAARALGLRTIASAAFAIGMLAVFRRMETRWRWAFGGAEKRLRYDLSR